VARGPGNNRRTADRTGRRRPPLAAAACCSARSTSAASIPAGRTAHLRRSRFAAGDQTRGRRGPKSMGDQRRGTAYSTGTAHPILTVTPNDAPTIKRARPSLDGTDENTLAADRELHPAQRSWADVEAGAKGIAITSTTARSGHLGYSRTGRPGPASARSSARRL